MTKIDSEEKLKALPNDRESLLKIKKEAINTIQTIKDQLAGPLASQKLWKIKATTKLRHEQAKLFAVDQKLGDMKREHAERVEGVFMDLARQTLEPDVFFDLLEEARSRVNN